MESTQQDQRTPNERETIASEAAFACYAVMLFVASVVTFGVGGIGIGMALIVFWACVLLGRSCLSRAIAMLALAFIAMIFALPGVDVGPASVEASRRMSCANNLKSIALAIHNYYDVYKSFPPAYIADADGRRMHSWRVLILPYLEDDACKSVYEAYNFDEPWDGPNNRELTLQMPRVFCCPSQCRYGSEPTGITNYFAVVGENTAWPGDRAIGFRDIIDGSSNTLLLLEATNRPITWTEPTDIELADALDILARREFAPHGYEDFFHVQPRGFNIALADGSRYYVVQQANDFASKLLIQRNDGEQFNVDSLQNNIVSPKPLRVANCIRLGVFCFLVLAPLLWIAWSPLERRETTRSAGQGGSKPNH